MNSVIACSGEHGLHPGDLGREDVVVQRRDHDAHDIAAVRRQRPPGGIGDPAQVPRSLLDAQPDLRRDLVWLVEAARDRGGRHGRGTRDVAQPGATRRGAQPLAPRHLLRLAIGCSCSAHESLTGPPGLTPMRQLARFGQWRLDSQVPLGHVSAYIKRPDGIAELAPPGGRRLIVVFGSINADLIFRMDAIPVPGQTLIADKMTVQPGGKGANQAVAAAQDGAVVRMIGAVGRRCAGRAGARRVARRRRRSRRPPRALRMEHRLRVDLHGSSRPQPDRGRARRQCRPHRRPGAGNGARTGQRAAPADGSAGAARSRR